MIDKCPICDSDFKYINYYGGTIVCKKIQPSGVSHFQWFVNCDEEIFFFRQSFGSRFYFDPPNKFKIKLEGNEMNWTKEQRAFSSLEELVGYFQSIENSQLFK